MSSIHISLNSTRTSPARSADEEHPAGLGAERLAITP
jgi:hypothetical protein